VEHSIGERLFGGALKEDGEVVAEAPIECVVERRLATPAREPILEFRVMRGRAPARLRRCE